MSEVSSGEETEAEWSEGETHAATPAELDPDNTEGVSNSVEEEVTEDLNAEQMAIAESAAESFGETGRGLLPGTGPPTLLDSTQSDWYAAVDGLLLRDPSDRAPLRVDHRGPELRGSSSGKRAWRRQEAGNSLRAWGVGIDDHADLIRAAAVGNVPIVELRTGETVHSGHLVGLLGGENIADAIMDVIGGLVNASRDHSVLVLPSQLLYSATTGKAFQHSP